ncbi:MAG TPA: DUF1326 domain-containing protein [Alphaproteobacteria bacterium]|nr:DUF1326 domain-containing protein [Alphaproteobacteria bacterium]
MAHRDWMIKGPKISACNCDYGCPCEFNARPTHPICEGLEAHRIDQGHFGAVKLDGLIIGARYRWPGPVHEGGGVAQGFIDERATPEQRDALIQIMSGKEQEPATPFNIYGATIARELDLIVAPVEFSADLESRTGGFRVPGMMEMSLEPIRNPVTGAPHRAQIRLPEGFEFREAEMASGRFESAGPELGMQHRNCYGFLTYVAYGPKGVIA